MPDPSTQDFLQIKKIQEGVVMLKDGGIRGVLMVSSMNFALKSPEEQNAIIFAFQSFLNSLDFLVQITVQSRNINITPYLDTIKNLEEKQTNELLKTQTSSYRQFIKDLVKGNSIMVKTFYVVIPYTILEALGMSSGMKKNPIAKIFGAKNPKVDSQGLSEEEFEKCKNQLWQRMEFVAMGLKRCGLEVIPLTTPELIELFWAIHHPDEAENGYYPEIIPELLK